MLFRYGDLDRSSTAGVSDGGEGDPLEMFTDNDGEAVFKKYSPVGELSPFAVQYTDVLSRACGMTVLVCDRDRVVAAAPILANGDMTGAVCMVQPETGAVLSERTSSWRRSLPLFSESGSKNEKAPPAKLVEPFW